MIITLLTSVNVETLWDKPEQALEELLPTVLKLASYHVRYSRICSPCELKLGEKSGQGVYSKCISECI